LIRLGENLYFLEDPQHLIVLIQHCVKGNREAQKQLYEQFYGYAMSICLRYTKSKDEAKEILNDGFMKVFTNIHKQTDPSSFKPWLRRTMINAAIDHYRRYQKHDHHEDINDATTNIASAHTTALDDISYGELILMVTKLPPAYRTVFNLYVIDGYTHEEIATQLAISVGASKSNLFKAREHLRALLKKNNIKKYA
jgi:RNA polymerase sigma-70 factor (ECF subfamily)